MLDEHFNKLTPAEHERLAYLAEEMCEAGQIIGKILRHGYESYDPTKPGTKPTNRELLARELGDVQRAINMMLAAGDLIEAEILRIVAKGPPSQYMHHQEKTDA